MGLPRYSLEPFEPSASARGTWVRWEDAQDAARHLDDLLLRFAFDAGALDDDTVASLGVDPWGTLAGFRMAFGLDPNMTAKEWASRNNIEEGP